MRTYTDLPTEILVHIARLGHPLTSDRMRRLDHRHQKGIRIKDLSWAEFAYRFSRGQCCWQWAAVNNHADVIQALLAMKSDHSTKHAALRTAAMCGSLDVVRMLLRYGVYPTLGHEKQTRETLVLEGAAEAGHYQIVMELLAVGVDQLDISMALCRASGKGHEKIVRALLSSGASVSSESVVNAAMNGHSGVIKVLLSAGAPIKSKNFGLLYATEAGHEEVARALISSGADVNFDLGQAVINASANGHANVLRDLLANGADQGLSRALWRACHYGHVEVVRLLIDAGVDVDCARVDDDDYEDVLDNETPLMQAASQGHNDIVCMLLMNGAVPPAGVNAEDLLNAAEGEMNVKSEVLGKPCEVVGR